MTPICCFQVYSQTYDEDNKKLESVPHSLTMRTPKLLVVFIIGLAVNLEAADWSHDTKDDWATLFPEFCSGASQSPIDLDSGVAVAPMKDPGPIMFHGYDIQGQASITNRGHGIVLYFDNSTQLKHSGGRLPPGDVFEFLSLHWHWGSDSNKGSEHTVDGKEFPMELHIIHWNKKYGSVDAALNHSDGLAVLGFFYEVSSEDNANLSPIVTEIPKVELTRKRTKRNIESSISNMDFFCEGINPNYPECRNSRSEDPVEASVGLNSLNQFLPTTGGVDSYYYYSGGLTTPKCNEIVLWTNFVSKNKISESQLAAFRSLKDGTGNGNNVVDNYRVPQPLNGRILSYRTGSQAWDMVSCGCHEAKTCGQCGKEPYMCNGDCTWSKTTSQCILNPKTYTTKCPARKFFN
jgi:carbonic anhydrase